MTTRSHLFRALARSIRTELNVLRSEVARLWRRRSSGPTIQRYLASHDTRCVHIGAGGNLLKEWLNTDLEPQSPDIAYLDVTGPLPFNDNSVDFIFSEHLIEHLPHADGVYHLHQCFRVLKPNGRVRVATPDLQFLVDIYMRSNHTEPQAKYIRRILHEAFPKTGFYNGAFVLNHFVRHWGHQFIYDEATLSDALRRAGFARTQRWSVGQSDEPKLQNIEHHGDPISDEFNLLQTIVLEGTKPAH